jgi:hypothetical protein
MNYRPLGAAVFAVLLVLGCAYASAQANRFLVTNDDNPAGNTATFYSLATTGTPTQLTSVATGGLGSGGGFFAIPRTSLARTNAGCIFVGNSGSGNVASIVESTLTLAGVFSGGSSDSGDLGLTMAGNYLYAGFGNSLNIATFRMNPDCTLQFLGDTAASDHPDGMKAHDGIMVVAYANGFMESFNISTGMPVANGDYQPGTGGTPAGVDLSRDGHWAVFGDATANGAVIEVSDISSGKLKTAVAYQVGTGNNSNNVRISPDQRFILVSNNNSGQVTAAFFDTTTGLISNSCTSPVLKGFASFISGLDTTPTKGGSGFVYVATGRNGISMLRLRTNGSSCSLTEISGSPTPDPQSANLLSLSTFAEY